MLLVSASLTRRSCTSATADGDKSRKQISATLPILRPWIITTLFRVFCSIHTSRARAAGDDRTSASHFAPESFAIHPNQLSSAEKAAEPSRRREGSFSCAAACSELRARRGFKRPVKGEQCS